MTYQEASRRAGIPASTCSALEKGVYNISIDQLFCMLKALGTPIQRVWPDGNGEISGKGNTRQPVRMEDVLKAVSKVFKVTPRRLESSERWFRLQEARGVCGILVREISGLRLRSLSKRLGMSESALRRLASRHRKQAEKDPHLASRIRSARKALGASTKDTKVHEILPL
jgi:transcriptional regulator with XRE-family HTH domain